MNECPYNIYIYVLALPLTVQVGNVLVVKVVVDYQIVV